MSLTGELPQLLLLVNLKMKLSQLPPRYWPLQGILNLSFGSWVLNKASFSSQQIVDPKTGEEKSVTISVDDGIRPGTTVSDLGRLKPVFKKDGSTTAGIRS